MRDIELRIAAVAESERREMHLPQQTGFQSGAEQRLPEATGVLWEFALSSGGDGEDDDCRLDQVPEGDRVQIKNGRVKTEVLCRAADFFGYILGIACF